MRWFVVLFLIAGMMLAVSAQDGEDAVPTLVPPTPVPQEDTGESEIIVTESAVTRIQETGRLRVGILYNAPPFGQLDIRGEITGFDADLARSIAETWDVELRLRQVTRQTAAEMLKEGRVDMLLAAQVHTRELDRTFEFSQSYHLGSLAMMVRSEEPANTLREFANRRIGVVMGSPAETSLADWSQRNSVAFEVETFLTMDRLYGALLGGQIDGMVSSRHLLLRAALGQEESIRIVEETFEQEPYAIALRRNDVPMRNLVNRTLHYLEQSSDMQRIRDNHFPESTYRIAVWDGLGEDAPNVGAVPTEITFPSQFTLPRVQAEGVVRVAGIAGVANGDTEVQESQRRLDMFHRALIDRMAATWGVSAQYIPANREDAVNLVANGQADIAVSVAPNWEWSDRVDFTGPYLLRGLRLMVTQNSDIFGFEQLIGGLTVATVFEEPEAREAANREAQRANVLINPFQTREADLALQILEDRNADVAFADIVRLLPHIEAYPDDLQLTDDWYSQVYVSMAVPQNDPDFRLLVEYTLQEMIRSGVLRDLLTPIIPPDEIPAFDIWPGSQTYLGIDLSQ